MNPGWYDAGGSALLLATSWFQQACDPILNSQTVGRWLGASGKGFCSLTKQTREGENALFLLDVVKLAHGAQNCFTHQVTTKGPV